MNKNEIVVRAYCLSGVIQILAKDTGGTAHWIPINSIGAATSLAQGLKEAVEYIGNNEPKRDYIVAN